MNLSDCFTCTKRKRFDGEHFFLLYLCSCRRQQGFLHVRAAARRSSLPLQMLEHGLTWPNAASLHHNMLPAVLKARPQGKTSCPDHFLKECDPQTPQRSQTDTIHHSWQQQNTGGSCGGHLVSFKEGASSIQNIWGTDSFQPVTKTKPSQEPHHI